MLKAGRSYSEIAASVDVSIGGLTKIKKRLAEQGLLTAGDQPEQPAGPASHVDENPAPPHGQRDADPR